MGGDCQVRGLALCWLVEVPLELRVVSGDRTMNEECLDKDYRMTWKIAVGNEHRRMRSMTSDE